MQGKLSEFALKKNVTRTHARNRDYHGNLKLFVCPRTVKKEIRLFFPIRTTSLCCCRCCIDWSQTPANVRIKVKCEKFFSCDILLECLDFKKNKLCL